MKLSAYIQKLQAVLDKDGDLEVVYAIDDEGNEFHNVNYDPSAGRFKNGEFNSESKKPNAVCVN